MCNEYIISLLASSGFCHLLITFANSLDPDWHQLPQAFLALSTHFQNCDFVVSYNMVFSATKYQVDSIVYFSISAEMAIINQNIVVLLMCKVFFTVMIELNIE